MTVLPCHSNLLVRDKELYQFLLGIKENCLQHNQIKIVSISIDIEWVDPLIVLQKMSEENKINFYFENQLKGEAIAAIDTIEKLEIDGKNRFIEVENFVKSCIKKIINFPSNQDSFYGPHFFCYFSFFETIHHVDYPFASATVFLPRWQIAVNKNRCTLVNNLMITATTNIENILEDLHSKIKLLKSLESPITNFESLQNNFTLKSVTNSRDFQIAVSSALEAINANTLNKIVLANALDVTAGKLFNLFKSLNNLRKIHPNCYIFSTSNGRGQNFIGASPERLISITNRRLISDALAGSAPRGKNAAEDALYANHLLNSEKEKHEHCLVIDFITEKLSQLNLSPEVLPPRLRQLSNIQHLWTPIQATVTPKVHPLTIVSQLHPTPAVAGSARDYACREIRRYEKFERGLYAAPLGWIDAQGNCEFIVAIRSALIDGDRARLYAGAGIVAGSHPEKEFAEVQLKLQALLKALV